MTRKEAAETLAIMIAGYNHIRKNETEWEAITMAIEALQGSEIIRCKDCRKSGVTDFGKMYCKEPFGMFGPLPIKADDFCSYGIPKEGEGE